MLLNHLREPKLKMLIRAMKNWKFSSKIFINNLKCKTKTTSKDSYGIFGIRCRSPTIGELTWRDWARIVKNPANCDTVTSQMTQYGVFVNNPARRENHNWRDS